MTSSAPRLVPELIVSELTRSLAFYETLGFTILYARPEERFAYLDREGAHLMLEEPTGRTFLAGELVPPYGRGVNFQIDVSDAQAQYGRVETLGLPVYLPLDDKWYRRADTLLGNRQFIVQAPDGYLLRFFEDLGAKPVSLT